MGGSCHEHSRAGFQGSCPDLDTSLSVSARHIFGTTIVREPVDETLQFGPALFRTGRTKRRGAVHHEDAAQRVFLDVCWMDQLGKERQHNRLEHPFNVCWWWVLERAVALVLHHRGSCKALSVCLLHTVPGG